MPLYMQEERYTVKMKHLVMKFLRAYHVHDSICILPDKTNRINLTSSIIIIRDPEIRGTEKSVEIGARRISSSKPFGLVYTPSKSIPNRSILLAAPSTVTVLHVGIISEFATHRVAVCVCEYNSGWSKKERRR